MNWRSEEGLARRMKLLGDDLSSEEFEARRFEWTYFINAWELRLVFADNPNMYAWLYRVADNTPLQNEEREAIENSARARYGL